MSYSREGVTLGCEYQELCIVGHFRCHEWDTHTIMDLILCPYPPNLYIEMLTLNKFKMSPCLEVRTLKR